jgi:hypothetical protein
MNKLPNEFDSYSTEDLLPLMQRVEQEISSRTLNEQREDILDSLSDFIHKGGSLCVYDESNGETVVIEDVQYFRSVVSLMLPERC